MKPTKPATINPLGQALNAVLSLDNSHDDRAANKTGSALSSLVKEVRVEEERKEGGAREKILAVQEPGLTTLQPRHILGNQVRQHYYLTVFLFLFLYLLTSRVLITLYLFLIGLFLSSFVEFSSTDFFPSFCNFSISQFRTSLSLTELFPPSLTFF